ncbi:MAG TPA: response regulator [Blastocatellia bacterium]|nr:response regulator [Blastocatellia bacterium]
MDKKKVLVIEDHRDTLAIYLIVLERSGFDVKLAWSGEKGLEEFKAWSPDVIVLDMMLPEMTGLEVLQRIRETGSNVPVVAATANIKPIVRDLCQELNVKSFLAKPFDFDQLITSVRSVLNVPEREVSSVAE